jgi:hypothetical protein
MKEIWEYLTSHWGKFKTYLSRRKQKSYTQLWEALYGDGWYEKGLYRDHEFFLWVSSGWAEDAKRLKKEVDELKKELELDHLDVGDLEESAYRAGFEVACNKISERINNEIESQRKDKDETEDQDERTSIFLLMAGLGLADRIIKWVQHEETQ